MVVYNEVFQAYDVIWQGMVISSTWSKENAEALVQELQERQKLQRLIIAGEKLRKL